jgi:hypothetical protein
VVRRGDSLSGAGIQLAWKKQILIFCVLCLMALSGNLAAKERHGANTVITKKDGRAVKGELIAVKMDSILLLISPWGIDGSIGISDISSIRIAKKSKALIGAISGSLLGGLAGAYIGQEVGEYHGGLLDFSTAFTIIGGAIGVLAGGGGGLLIGSHVKDWEKFDIEGKSPEGIKMILERLRSRARVPNFR